MVSFYEFKDISQEPSVDNFAYMPKLAKQIQHKDLRQWGRYFTPFAAVANAAKQSFFRQ